MKVLKGEVEESRDLISDLPLPILHRVLSFLSFEDSIRTAVLSKQWYGTRMSFPILKFSTPVNGRRRPRGTPEYEAWLGEYLYHVDSTLHYFVQTRLCIECMDLCLDLIPLDFLRMVDTWLPLALHCGVSNLSFEVTIDHDAYFCYPLPEITFAVYPSLLLGSSGFVRLQKLELRHVCLCEDIVRDIIRNCPNLGDLKLCYILKLETLSISEPNKLVSLSVEQGEINNFSVDALSLRRFSLELDGPCLRGVIALTSCSNLRELELHYIVITDDVFHLHISRVPLLEVLNISDCDFLRRIRISLPRLKDLQIISCSGLEAVEIDAPLLSVFYFWSLSLNLPELATSSIIHGSMDFCYDIRCTIGPIDSLWFLRLRECLRAPFDSVTFRTFSDGEEVEFDPGEIRFDTDELIDVVIPPPAGVECLDLSDTQISPSSCWVTFLKGLLWSCHPKTIHANVTVDSGDEDNCIKVLCNMLMQSKCLKAAKIESIGGNALNIESTGGIEHKQFLHVLDTFVSFPKCSIVNFTLDWDPSAIQGLAIP